MKKQIQRGIYIQKRQIYRENICRERNTGRKYLQEKDIDFKETYTGKRNLFEGDIYIEKIYIKREHGNRKTYTQR